MRRGFKTEAKRLALELRAEIGLDAHAPFDPYAFASEYGIPVVERHSIPRTGSRTKDTSATG